MPNHMGSGVVVDDASTVGEGVRLYDLVHLFGSRVGDLSTVSQGTDLINSSVASCCDIGRRNLLIDSEIGVGTFTGANDVISNVRVGKYCCISWAVSLGGVDHNYRAASMLNGLYWRKLLRIEPEEEGTPPPLTIGNDVWIASGANILSGLRIGDGAVIGANALVTRDVPPYAIVVGQPARVMKYRFEEAVVERLRQVSWWDWPVEEVRKHAGLLQGDLTEEKLVALETAAFGISGDSAYAGIPGPVAAHA